jgi:drug/metabolite transporter (DMT)-like permease
MRVQGPPPASHVDDPTGYRPFPRTARDEGSEVRLARWATAYQVIGWFLIGLGVLALLLVFKTVTNPLADEVGASLFTLIMIMFIGGASSLFFSALLHGAADVVRLLKRSSNLPYSGEIQL